ncbi:MAG: hypothetical protein AAB836_01515 [Patescibacteria group bacterium]
MTKNLTINLPRDVYETVHFLSERDKTTEAEKVVEILEDFLETQEDEYWNKIAEGNDTNGAKFISFEAFWKDALAHAAAR